MPEQTPADLMARAATLARLVTSPTEEQVRYLAGTEHFPGMVRDVLSRLATLAVSPEQPHV